MNNKIKIIAEIGINHNGSVISAMEMITSAAECRADYVKFQTFNPDLLYSRYTQSLLESGIEKDGSGSPIDFFRKFVFTKDEYKQLANHSQKCGVEFLSSPFDTEGVDLLEELGVGAYKIASSEATNYPLLEYVASTKKKVFLATGMTTLSELHKSIRILKDVPELVLMHCVSIYPPEIADLNLERLNSLKKEFNLPVGLSDHTPTIDSSLAAIALGSTVIEKHFKLSDTFDCPDGNVSIAPPDLKKISNFARVFPVMMGDGSWEISEKELNISRGARRSIYAAREIHKGEVIKSEDLVIKRPGIGLTTDRVNDIVGKKAMIDIHADYMIRLENLEN